MIVDGLKYQTLLYYADNNLSKIPEYKGVYNWVYYPDINPDISKLDFIRELKKYSEVTLSLPETFKNQKFSGEVNEIWFDKNDSDILFGLSRSKSEYLNEYLSKSNENRKEFMSFFKDLCFKRPFYVGMTENLRSRLASHISGNGSELMDSIKNLSIQKGYIWIAFSQYPDQMDSKLIKIHEEISQKFLKPGLTKKFG